MKAHWGFEPGEQPPREIPFRYLLLFICAMVWALIDGTFA